MSRGSQGCIFTDGNFNSMATFLSRARTRASPWRKHRTTTERCGTEEKKKKKRNVIEKKCTNIAMMESEPPKKRLGKMAHENNLQQRAPCSGIPQPHAESSGLSFFTLKGKEGWGRGGGRERKRVFLNPRPPLPAGRCSQEVTICQYTRDLETPRFAALRRITHTAALRVSSRRPPRAGEPRSNSTT